MSAVDVEHAGAQKVPKASVERLESSLKQLGTDWEKLTVVATTRELIPIIHRPGWTTPAEILFVQGVVDLLHAQIEVIARMQQLLKKGAEKVGQEQMHDAMRT